MSAKIVSCAVVVAAVLAALASDALASPGAGSISSSDGSWIYMVSPQSGGGTVITKIRGSDRTAQVKRRLPGSFEVPEVAGDKGGLSRDGSLLVLGGHPSARVSQFALVDTRTLRVQRVLSLRGTYSFDAMSPDASKLYVIRFLSHDGTHYAVQGVDLTAQHPVAKTLVEKGEPGEAMSGHALTRTTSRDGTWVYTLYDGAHGAPFVHALSTVDSITVCIDLDALEGRHDLASLDLKPGPHSLDITGTGGALATIDTDTFKVTAHPAALEARAAPAAARTVVRDAGTRGGDVPWALIAAIALVVAVAATLGRRRISGALRARG